MSDPVGDTLAWLIVHPLICSVPHKDIGGASGLGDHPRDWVVLESSVSRRVVGNAVGVVIEPAV